MSTKISWMGVTEPYGPFTVQAEHRTEPANSTHTPCLLRLDSFWDCCQWHIYRVCLGYLRVVFEPETQEAEVPFCTLQLLILYEVAYQVPLCDPPVSWTVARARAGPRKSAWTIFQIHILVPTSFFM